MDAKKIWAVFALALLFIGLAVAWPHGLPPGNHSQHDVQQNEQRNETSAGAGIPGGTDQYWPTYFPMPSPKGHR